MGIKLSRVVFGRASDEWATPRDLFDALDAEFHFALDAAATSGNALCKVWLGPDSEFASRMDALKNDWCATLMQGCFERWSLEPGAIWLNPPYSQCRAFIAKAAAEAQRGCTVVCLVPSRTDTRWWHAHVWDDERNALRPGVEVRFIKGRLKFGNSTNSAPFPSVIIIFRPVEVL